MLIEDVIFYLVLHPLSNYRNIIRSINNIRLFNSCNSFSIRVTPSRIKY